MVEDKTFTLASAQRLLADMRRCQLQCALAGKIEQSADYAFKAKCIRRVIERCK